MTTIAKMWFIQPSKGQPSKEHIIIKIKSYYYQKIVIIKQLLKKIIIIKNIIANYYYKKNFQAYNFFFFYVKTYNNSKPRNTRTKVNHRKKGH